MDANVTTRIDYILPRKTTQDLGQVINLYNFCKENFGESLYYKNWSVQFADDTDDWVKFTFYNPEFALFVKLRFPDLITEDEWQYMQSIALVNRYL